MREADRQTDRQRKRVRDIQRDSKDTHTKKRKTSTTHTHTHTPALISQRAASSQMPYTMVPTVRKVDLEEKTGDRWYRSDIKRGARRIARMQSPKAEFQENLNEITMHAKCT